MIGEALRLIRVFHDLKQNELAGRLGMSKSYLSAIESGAKEPTLALIQKYSKEFDIPVSSIVFFAENVNENSSYRKAKTIVAGKILKLLRFLEERSNANDVD